MAEVRIEGARQFAAALRTIDRKYSGQVSKANLSAARAIATHSRRNARGLTGLTRIYRDSGSSIRGGSSGRAGVIIGGGGATPYFWAAEYGGRRRSGWYANHPSNSSRRQWLPWRGNQWRSWAGGPGYMINPAIRDHADEVLAEYERKIIELYRIAFPG